MVLHENSIDLALLRQFLRITAVVELVAALVGAKFLIAAAFQGAATFLTKTLRNICIHTNQTQLKGFFV
jgi:hypothetical protein